MRHLALLAALGACTIDEPTPAVDLGTFPYHPLVFELDLAILAYQLHAQSMVWPIDPFYEEHEGSPGTSRDDMMARVRTWAALHGPAQVAAMPGLDGYRGPGVLAGLPDNPAHDPIIYDYARIHPWSHAITNNQDQWTEYLVPDPLVRRIRDVYVAARPIGGDGTNVVVTAVPPGRDDADAGATDTLCAFEGGTGDKGEPGQPASYSLMGFVLARDVPGGYDVHLAFRGSRSGSAFRAASDALSTAEAKGNPDWITDLGWDKVQLPAIARGGGVSRGFAHSMESILPGVVACLSKVAEGRGRPTNIYVTGHSLGGGLAQDFTSAVLFGTQLGPLGLGPETPDPLRTWNWRAMKLVTFSAPRAGDFVWASAMSDLLQSKIYDPGPIETVDADARLVLDPGIVTALHDPMHPAAFRVLVSTDPITTTKIGGDGTHLGTTVYVNGTSVIDWLGIVNADDHEPAKVRKYMTDAFADPRTPELAWRYRPTTDLVPDRDATQKGTPAEMQKLAAGLRAYYANGGMYFDDAAFARDVDLLFAIEQGTAN